MWTADLGGGGPLRVSGEQPPRAGQAGPSGEVGAGPRTLRREETDGELSVGTAAA